MTFSEQSWQWVICNDPWPMWPTDPWPGTMNFSWNTVQLPHVFTMDNRSTQACDKVSIVGTYSTSCNCDNTSCSYVATPVTAWLANESRKRTHKCFWLSSKWVTSHKPWPVTHCHQLCHWYLFCTTIMLYPNQPYLIILPSGNVNNIMTGSTCYLVAFANIPWDGPAFRHHLQCQQNVVHAVTLTKPAKISYLVGRLRFRCIPVSASDHLLL